MTSGSVHRLFSSSPVEVCVRIDVLAAFSAFRSLRWMYSRISALLSCIFNVLFSFILSNNATYTHYSAEATSRR